MHGPFGVGWLNESGETLLSFCTLNQLCYEYNVSKEEDSPVYLAAPRYQVVALYRLCIVVPVTASLLY